ncbi:MAG: FtsX-like permease family protein [Imperialibacter sp.]|uniref:FtsX-like permease family protein n=1 Tax=Imperialibacter sp. TaxID=2038411 RepID=UPI0032EB69FF
MNLPLFIARKYFVSKKKKNFINVISIISMVGVAVGTMALIIGLSFFNGLEDILRNLYGTFDSQIKVEASKGKTFAANKSLIDSIAAVPGVSIVSEVIEDFVLISYNDTDMVAKIKGVSDNFISNHRFEEHLVQGELLLKKDKMPRAIIGRGIQYALSISANNDFLALQLHYPKNVNPGSLSPSSYFNKQSIMPGGFFALEKQYDETYIFVPLDFAVTLTEFGNKRTSLELQLQEGFTPEAVKPTLQKLLGDQFKIQTSEEQHSDLFKILKWEKFFVFLTFSFIVAIASFNIFFSLSMLALEKKKDVAILYALGATDKLIRRIFVSEGALIGLIGASVGLVLGLTISYLQQQFGVISLGMQSSIVDAYPVLIDPLDVAVTAVLSILVTLLASYRPAYLASKSKFIGDL